MTYALPHPVIALLANLRQESSGLESEIREMNRKARRTPVDYGRYDAVRQERTILAAEIHQMKRKVHRTPFDYLGYSAEVQFILRAVILGENKIEKQVLSACRDVDRALIKLSRIRVKIKHLESEVRRKRIGRKQSLVYSTVLRPGPITGEPTGFLNLPTELRNYISDLSGCLGCRKCLSCWDSFDRFPEGRGCREHVRRPFPITFNSGTKPQVKEKTERDHGTYRLSRTWDEPALLRVSRQVRSDTLPMFFGMLPVTFWPNDTSWEKILGWLRSIGKEKAAMLRDIMMLKPRDPQIYDDLLVTKKPYSLSGALLAQLAELGVRVEVEGLLH